MEKLITDPDADVRCAVAEQGYGLDRLIEDPSWFVREEVALHGYGLDRLIDDESLTVRAAVAYSGYGLDKLATDPHGEVREAVDEALWDNDLTLEEWIAQNPDKCALPENRLHHKTPKREKPERARSLEELAARGREKAEEHNRNLKGNEQPNLDKRTR